MMDPKPVPTPSASRSRLKEISDRIGPLLRALPPDARRAVVRVWEGLSPDVRAELRIVAMTLERFLADEKGAMRMVMELVGRTITPAVGALSDVALVGPVNVGKSSIYNALLAEQGSAAVVSPLPGTTSEVLSSSVGPFKITDTPGAEHWADVDAVELERAMQAAREASFLVVVFDASRGILAADRVLYERVKALGKPHVVALNKIDLIAPRLREEVRAAAANALLLEPAQVLPVSAKDDLNIDRLLLEIAVAEPRLLGYLGMLIPAMRRKLAWQAVRRATTTAMAVALIPLPFVDLLPLMAIQVGLILTLARIYGQQMGARRAGDIIATFGVGMLGRTLFHELVKMGGVPGWVLGASIAGATTMSLGVGAMRWFESGRRPTKTELKSLFKTTQGRLAGILKAAFRRRPKKGDLTKRLDEALPQDLDLENPL